MTILITERRHGIFGGMPAGHESRLCVAGMAMAPDHTEESKLVVMRVPNILLISGVPQHERQCSNIC